MANTQSYFDGGDLMLFIEQNGQYKSIAHSTSHSLSNTSENKSILTKDADINYISKLNSTISCEHLFTFDIVNLYKIFEKKEKIKVVFGRKTETEFDTNWSADKTQESENDFYWQGTGNITSLNINAQVGNEATCSVEIAIDGVLKLVTKQD